MKTTQALALVTVVFGVATDAVSIRGLFKKGAEEHTDDAAANNEAISAHNEAISANNEADQSDRRLDCSTVLAWHPTYSAGWTKGYCQFTVDCNSPSYGSELACCKGAYGGQTSGYCISQLDSPPTQSPTESGGLDVYYPDYATPWAEAGCINTRPLPSGRPTYSTMISCCKGAYAGQMSGKCLSNLPTPPTISPTTDDFETDFWYPDYDTPWADAGCSNKLPLPFNNKNDRPNYTTQLACCKGAYGGQTSGKCLSQLPIPPTISPTTDDFETDFWYPDYDTPWPDAGCSNKLPLPFNNKNDRPNYTTQLACCKGAYGGQTSGKCLSQLPIPPTTSPTEEGGVGDVWYPDYDTPWTDATCLNTRPLPFTTGSRPTYTSLLACCKGAYGAQASGKCLASLPSPPTTSPTDLAGVGNSWYPDYDSPWDSATCLNTTPLPFGPGWRPIYSTEAECCQKAYAGQSSADCMCNVDPCYSCKCGDAAYLLANSCTSLVC